MSRQTRGIALLAASMLLACSDPQDPVAGPSFDHAGPVVPAPLAQVSFGGSSIELWPYTGTDVHGAIADPINLLFPGGVDARSLRAALLLLDGDRSAFGFPNVAPFDCTWKDGVGGNQTTYTTAAGWVGSAIQLECGDYAPIRFHVRFFPAGDWTVAGVHFEVLIPGTSDHAVISWELAEQLIVVDFLRSGILDPSVPLGASGAINPAPYGEINPLIYNGLPVELRGAIGGPLGNVGSPVPILTDGQATIVNVATATAAAPLVLIRDYILEFDQVIPKPFCASGPFDYLYVKGPVQFRQRLIVNGAGNYVSQFHAHGRLELTPVNPLTSPPTPVGPTFEAIVSEHYQNVMTDATTLVANFTMRFMIPPTAPYRGQLTTNMRVGPGSATGDGLRLVCN